MDRGGTYATLVLPATLTRSALLAAGVPTPGRPPPPTAAVALEQNTRLGTLGVNLATGVVSPAIAQIAPQIGSQLSSLSTPAARANPIRADRLATPVSLTTTPYRPLPDHSALGLSAFYGTARRLRLDRSAPRDDLFWAAVGLGASAWYDHKKLDRISPDVIDYINQSVDQAVARRGSAKSSV